jgi:hypothetical protein
MATQCCVKHNPRKLQTGLYRHAGRTVADFGESHDVANDAMVRMTIVVNLTKDQ